MPNLVIRIHSNDREWLRNQVMPSIENALSEQENNKLHELRDNQKVHIDWNLEDD